MNIPGTGYVLPSSPSGAFYIQETHLVDQLAAFAVEQRSSLPGETFKPQLQKVL
jgi:hypothetical protein